MSISLESAPTKGLAQTSEGWMLMLAPSSPGTILTLNPGTFGTVTDVCQPVSTLIDYWTSCSPYHTCWYWYHDRGRHSCRYHRRPQSRAIIPNIRYHSFIDVLVPPLVQGFTAIVMLEECFAFRVTGSRHILRAV